MAPAASVIVRSRDKAGTIEATLRSVRAQSVPVEVLVVDSGSADATVQIAERYADRVLHVTGPFSYGGSLNLGAAAATAPVHVALSAHCVLPTATWVEDCLRHHARDDVAAVSAARLAPDGTPLTGPYDQRLADARDHPAWGFSNHAATWRASVWRELPFREDLPACEDKEWSWRVLARGWTVVYDPALRVPLVHRRAAGLRSLWRRVHTEHQALAALGALPRPGRGELARRWWSESTPHDRFPPPLQRLNPYRAVELHAAVTGTRSARPLPGPDHAALTGARATGSP